MLNLLLLIRQLSKLSDTHYGGGTMTKLPFMGGYVELDLKFDNGLINVVSAKCWYLGEQVPHSIKTGYTDEIQLARRIQDTILALSGGKEV